MAAPLRPILAQLRAYQPEESLGDAPLDANENPYAPPRDWLARAAALAKETLYQRYPDPAASGLRKRLAALHSLPEDGILFGNGSDELIGLLLTAFGGEGALCLLPRPTFSMYRLCALGLGWKVHEEELGTDWGLTPAFVEAAKRLKPRLIFLASPNNPTGQAFDPALVDALRGLEHSTLVLDEAYAEFGGRSLLAASSGEPGLVVLRTFSKAWGLAGLRLGWLSAQPALVKELEKVRLPYNLNSLTQALACEALDMAPAFLGRVPGLLAQRRRLEAALAGVPGMTLWPSDSNFVLARHARSVELHAHLLKQGLRVRRFEGGALEHCIRINAGDEAQTARLEAALAAFAKQEGASAR
ncbi:MAG TPA: histidinol-phosphate transaminase [bacterium]|nr:histidinol-phosphate transaminase [bacterium]